MFFARNFLYFILLTFSITAFCADVSSISQSTAINFGSIDALSGGTISNCVTSGPRILTGSGCTAASFNVIGQDSSGLNATTFKIFITNPVNNLSSGGGNAPVSFSLSSGSSVTSQTYDFAPGGGVKNFSVPIYGDLTIAVLQAPGSYSGDYTVIACSCNNDGCPSSSSDPLCN